MPAGSSQKREREFKNLEQKFRQSHRYPGREEEVAARIVNKQRSEYGETSRARDQERKGASPDKNLPLKNFQHLTIPQVLEQIETLSVPDIKRVRAYEVKHKNRKGLVAKLDKQLAR